MKLGGKNDNKWCVITAYWVVQEKVTQLMSKTFNMSYWQQVKASINNRPVNPDPRNQVLHDLTSFIDEQKLEGYEIILMMDANEAAKAKNSKITEFVTRNSLHDVHQTIVRDLLITTRLESKNQIDFMFIAEGIMQMI